MVELTGKEHRSQGRLSAREKLHSCFRKDRGCGRQRKRRALEVGPSSHDMLRTLPEDQGASGGRGQLPFLGLAGEIRG